MPRAARIVIPGVPLHVIQRGNNRGACFVAHVDRLVYLNLLQDSAQRMSCAVHAYVLMTNHVHILLSPSHAHSAGELMKSLGQRYVQYINRRYARTGTLWEGRFRSLIVGDERYLLTCQRYIELNPVRAGIVPHPSLYTWSSYSANAAGKRPTVIKPHDVYMGLGCNAAQRQGTYRALFDEVISEETIRTLRRPIDFVTPLRTEGAVTRG